MNRSWSQSLKSEEGVWGTKVIKDHLHGKCRTGSERLSPAQGYLSGAGGEAGLIHTMGSACVDEERLMAGGWASGGRREWRGLPARGWQGAVLGTCCHLSRELPSRWDHGPSLDTASSQPEPPQPSE